MGKASELDDSIRPLSEEEMEKRRGGPRPELRLRQELLEQAVAAGQPVGEVLARLGNGALATSVLHDAESGATAVAIPVERYLQLVEADIADRQQTEVTLEGGFRIRPTALDSAGVEQVDPNAGWGPPAPHQTWA